MADTPMNPASRRPGFANFCKRSYVGIMLGLVPLLVGAGSRISRSMGAETSRIPEGFSFALKIDGTGQACACLRKGSGWKRLPANAADKTDYAIEFHDVDYAFAVFSGRLSLKDALAARLFSTKGSNSLGVALTYMFTILLKTFFFWRAAYRSQQR